MWTWIPGRCARATPSRRAVMCSGTSAAGGGTRSTWRGTTACARPWWPSSCAPTSSRTRRALAALAAEAALLDRLAHPGLLRGFGARLDGPRPHLVLEHIEGPRLSTWSAATARARAAPAAGAVRRGRPALPRATSGVVHLDVKPRNIILGGPPRLIDLSVARALDGAGPAGVGTDAYMAPEQCDPARFGDDRPARRRLGPRRDAHEAIAGGGRSRARRPALPAAPRGARRPAAARRPRSRRSSRPAWTRTRPRGRSRMSSRTARGARRRAARAAAEPLPPGRRGPPARSRACVSGDEEGLTGGSRRPHRRDARSKRKRSRRCMTMTARLAVLTLAAILAIGGLGIAVAKTLDDDDPPVAWSRSSSARTTAAPDARRPGRAGRRRAVRRRRPHPRRRRHRRREQHRRRRPHPRQRRHRRRGQHRRRRPHPRQRRHRRRRTTPATATRRRQRRHRRRRQHVRRAGARARARARAAAATTAATTTPATATTRERAYGMAAAAPRSRPRGRGAGRPGPVRVRGPAPAHERLGARGDPRPREAGRASGHP